MKKIIVIGGAGFIGTNVCLSGLEKGLHVVLFDNFSRKGTRLNLKLMQAKYPPDRLEVITGDIRSFKRLYDLFKQHEDADAIFHLAGQVAVTTSIKDPRDDFEANLLGTFNILEAMRACRTQAPILYASTNKVYGKLADIKVVEQEKRCAYEDCPDGITETQPLDFYSPYGCSKGAADQYMIDYARIFGLKTIVFRQSCIYGPYQFGIEDQGWVAWFALSALFNLPITIYGNGKQVRDVLYIDDLMAAYWSALNAIDVTCGQAYNIGGGACRMSLLELIEYLQEYTGKDLDIFFSDARPGDQPVFICDSRKARQAFGWQPQTQVKEGVTRLMDWMSANKALFIKAKILPDKHT